MKAALIILLAFTLMLSAWPAQGQTKADSLKAQLNRLKGEARLGVLCGLARTLYRSRPEEALHYAEEALAIAENSGGGKELFDAKYILGRTHYYLGNFTTSVQYFKEALSIEDKSIEAKSYAFAHSWMGEAYRNLASPAEALKAYQRALEVYNKAEDYGGQASSYNNIGLLYKTQGEYTKAIDFYNKALQLNLRVGDSIGIASAYHNMATVFMVQHKYEDAFPHLLQALQIKRATGDERSSLTTLNNLGSLYIETSQYKKAEEVYFELVSIAQKLQDSNSIAYAYVNLADNYHRAGQPEKAISYGRKALEIPIAEEPLVFRMGTYELLANIFDSLGDSRNALHYFRQYLLAKDSAMNLEKLKQFNDIKAQFESKAREREITLLEKDRQVARLQRNFLAAGSAMLLLLSVISVYSLRLKNRKNQLLLVQSQQLYEKEMALSHANLEKSQLKQAELEKELEFKNKQLTTHTLNIIQKNKMMEQVKSYIGQVKKGMDRDTSRKLSQLSRTINYSLNLDKDWDEFRNYFDRINTDFFKNLKRDYPELTSTDLKLCALVKLNFSIKETASILNISPGSVKTARYRLRRKLNLNAEEELSNILIKY